MGFHFPLMPRIFMAVRQEDRHPIVDILRQTPELPPTCQWALFLRNHDELTLEMVTDEERDYMYQAYAADPHDAAERRHPPAAGAAHGEQPAPRRAAERAALHAARHAGHLLRRRDRDGRQHLSRRPQRRSHPHAVERRQERRLLAGGSGAAVRAADHGSGLRVPVDQCRGAGALSVLAAELDEAPDWRFASSIRCWPRRPRVLSRARTAKCSPTCGATRTKRSWSWPTCPRRRSRSRWSFGHSPGLVPVEMLGQTEFPRIGEPPYLLTLGPLWLPAVPAEQSVARSAARAVTPEPVAESVDARPALLAGVHGTRCSTAPCAGTRARRARRIPRSASAGRRLARELAAARFVDWGVLRAGTHPVFLTIVEAERADGRRERYLLPLATVVGAEAERIARDAPRPVLARITGARKGLLVDAVADDRACELLLEALGDEPRSRGAAWHDSRGSHRRLAARRSCGPASDPPRAPGPAEQLRFVRLAQALEAPAPPRGRAQSRDRNRALPDPRRFHAGTATRRVDGVRAGDGRARRARRASWPRAQRG